MEYLLTFHTHSGAIKYRKHLRSIDLELKLKPVPRKVSSNCGVAGSIETETNLLEHTTNSIEAIYEVRDNSFFSIFKND